MIKLPFTNRTPKHPKFNPETANIDELWYYADREADAFEKYRTVNRTAAATLAGVVALSALKGNVAVPDVLAFSSILTVGLYSARAGVMHGFKVLKNPLARTPYSRSEYRIGADAASAVFPLAVTTSADFIGRSVHAPTPWNIATASLASLISGTSFALDRWTGNKLRYQVEHVGETPQPLPPEAYVRNEEAPIFRDAVSPASPVEPSNFEMIVTAQNPQNPDSIFVQPEHGEVPEVLAQQAVAVPPTAEEIMAQAQYDMQQQAMQPPKNPASTPTNPGTYYP